mmetsp:Transcript_50031/g.150513  ORF Transcript_50031/g.150513 Transcript_50031/m.150513 type:complete len:319 (+) Transcript_50031:336-1292(+)
MPQRNSPAIGIDPGRIQTELADTPRSLRSEGLVNLVHVHILLQYSALVQRDRYGDGGPHTHDGRRDAPHGERPPNGEDGDAAPLGLGAAHEQDGGRAVGHLAGISSGRRPGLPVEDRPQLGQDGRGRSRPNSVVAGHERRSAVARHEDGNDLLVEFAPRLRGRRAAVRLGREGVEVGPSEAVLLRHILAGHSHGYEAFHGLRRALHGFPVHVRGGHLGHVVRAHALDPGPDAHFNLTARDRVGDVGHRLQSRAALPIHRREGGRVGYARGELGHPRTHGAGDGGEHVSDAHVLDGRGGAGGLAGSPGTGEYAAEGGRQ